MTTANFFVSMPNLVVSIPSFTARYTTSTPFHIFPKVTPFALLLTFCYYFSAKTDANS